MVKISVEIENSLTGLLEDHFCEFGVSNWGIERINDKTPPELFGYFENDAEADESYKSLRDSFPELPEFYSMEQVNDVDWQNEYKKFLKPWNFENLHWVPLWMRGEYEVGQGDLVLYFDAGLAFCTGDHPTTRLCAMSMLEYAKAHDVSGKYIIDAGCGSGILALSAKLLGFGKILGFDRDEEAVRVSKENAALNGINLDGVTFEHAGIEKALAGQKADIVLANIISDVLCIYADNLIDSVKDGGLLVLSGILAVENDKVKEYFLDRAGDRVAQCEAMDMGEWSRLEIRFK